MKSWFRFLWIPLLAALAGCEDADWKQKDASGFSKSERFDATLSGTVLPGMAEKDVLRIWGKPHGKQKTGDGEEWVYYSGGASGGYDVHTTVRFAQGKVTDVLNGDLMTGHQKEGMPDMAPDMRPGAGAQSSGSPGFVLPTGVQF
jgi:hypothetical protein